MSDKNSANDVMKTRKEEKAEEKDGIAKSIIKDKIGKTAKKLNKKAKKLAKKATKKAIKAGAVTIGSAIVMILVAIFMIVGLAIFIITMPGLVQEGMMQKFASASQALEEFFKGINASLEWKDIKPEDKIQVLQYLQDMGIDVVGYGFVSDAVVNSEGKVVDYFEDDEITDKDSEAYKKTIFRYIVAAQRIFTRYGGGLFGFDKQTGMLNISGDWGLDGIEAEVDKETKRLNITSNNAHFTEWLNEDGFSFNIAGWAGRYGMPLDLTLTLHLATMSSGFVEELLTNDALQTSVNIDLKEINAKIEYKIQTTDGSNVEISYDNGVDLSTKYANGEKITKDDISIVGLVNFVNVSGSENKYNGFVKLINGDINEDIASSGMSFGGFKKNIDAIKALTGNNEFLCDPENRIYDSNLNAETSNLALGVYICDYNSSDNTINENTGIIGTKIVSNKTAQNGTIESIVEYKKVGNSKTYACYANDKEITSASEKVLDLENNPEYDGEQYKFDYVVMEGLKNKTELEFLVTMANTSVGSVGTYMRDISLNGDTAEINNNEAFRKLYAYYRMFEQADNFIVGYAIGNLVTYQNSDNIKLIDMSELDKLSTNYGFKYNFKDYITQKQCPAGGYYTQAFEKMCNENDFSNLDNILNDLRADSETIEKIITSESSKLDEILKEAGYEDLTMDVVNNIYVNAKLNTNDVNYVQPRITSVVKHWFKDVNFEVESNYTKTTEPTIMKYTGTTGFTDDKYVVTATITPNGNGNAYYKDNKKPYVIKGEVVYCDGEVIGDTSDSEIKEELGSTGIDDYNWGDGYRATKKIFTQGAYYTFDGSAETTKSIYYQEHFLEQTEGMTLFVNVKGGRISVCREAGDEETVQGVTIKDLRYDNYNYYYNGWSEDVMDKTTFVDSGTDDVKIRLISTNMSSGTYGAPEEVRHYLVYIGSDYEELPLAYKSTANPKDDVSYEEAMERVDKINKVWDAMGVTIKRKPVTFDGKSAEGNYMALTAFSILENSKSEDSEAIYRDLKELLIDLGYFTKAEFDYLSTNVLNWFIPDYIPKAWPQNSENDIYEYGAILYPYKEDDDKSSEVKEEREDGFTPDLDVIAPGNCRVLDYSEDTIKIEFDGASQPEIGILNGYVMIIKGIDVNSELTFVNENNEESTISMMVAKNKSKEIVIPAGTVIGKTGTDKIQVVMKNNREAIINNVEDYMSPDIAIKGNVAATMWHYFYYIPYESGALNNKEQGAGSAVTYVVNDGREWAVGICQWTIRGNMDGIKPLLTWLYQQDTIFCAELRGFQSWNTSQITDNFTEIQNAFKTINSRDSEKFLALQMQYALEEKKTTISNKKLDWVLEPNRHPVVAGTLMSLINWKPAWKWESVINNNMSDEEVVKTLLAYAYYKSPEASGSDTALLESWRNRWESQAKFAVDMINGKYTNAEEFVRNGTTGDASIYANGKNKGFLKSTLTKNGW